MNKGQSLAALYREAGIGGLLSPPEANPKVAKNGKLGVYGAVLHLAAGDMSGREVCPFRSPGCSAACLMFAGNPAYFKNKNQARIKKTNLFFDHRDLFMNILVLEIAKLIKKAEGLGMQPAVRLNGTSDIIYEKKAFKLYDWVKSSVFPEGVPVPPTIDMDDGSRSYIIPELFPNVQFYDYTKIPGRTPPANYHLTFSESEINAENVQKEMARGLNIASVFYAKKLPEIHLGRPVINGDEHDFRPADPQGVIVGLKVKGLGKKDATGFVVPSLA